MRDDVAEEYTQARKRLDVLGREAAELGQRIERLGRSLSGYASRISTGDPDQNAETDAEWDALLSEALPQATVLRQLTNDIREAALSVRQLRERLVLMGRADLVEQPDWYFH